MIRFSYVTKKFGSHAVLDKVNFAISPGEMVLLNGASGAGKSTIVALLIGAEKPDEGRVEVDGVAVNEMDDAMLQFYRRKLGVVYQDYKLLPQKTVFENAAFAMEVCESPSGDIARRVPEVLAKVGLIAMKDHFPGQLSGGERQRLAIARSLVHHPRLLIADEPTGNLDEVNTREIVNLFTKLNSEGATILLTTHDPLVYSLINGKVFTLAGGRIT